jgi:predicted enzyme related to lactoylglutathione lyase
MSRVVHFEVHTDDPEAVRPVYESVFGWKVQKLRVGVA